MKENTKINTEQDVIKQTTESSEHLSYYIVGQVLWKQLSMYFKKGERFRRGIINVEIARFSRYNGFTKNFTNFDIRNQVMDVYMLLDMPNSNVGLDEFDSCQIGSNKAFQCLMSYDSYQRGLILVANKLLTLDDLSKLETQ